MTLPAELNSLSVSVLVGGADKYFLASLQREDLTLHPLLESENLAHQAKLCSSSFEFKYPDNTLSTDTEDSFVTLALALFLTLAIKWCGGG